MEVLCAKRSMVGLAGKNCEDTTAEFSEEAALIMKNL